MGLGHQYFGECRSDGNFRTGIGNSDNTTMVWWVPFVCPGTGTREVKTLETGCKSNAGTSSPCRMAIYNSTGTSRIYQTAQFNVTGGTDPALNGWFGETGITGVTLTGGTTYLIVMTWNTTGSGLASGAYYNNNLTTGAADTDQEYYTAGFPADMSAVMVSPTLGSVGAYPMRVGLSDDGQSIANFWELRGIFNQSPVTVTTTAHTLFEPPGTTEGDLIVAAISYRSANINTVTLPANWNLIASNATNNVLTTTGAIPSGLLAYIIRGPSAPSYTFTHPAAPSVAVGKTAAYRGVDRRNPLDTSTLFQTATNTTAVSGTGVTTNFPNDLIFVAACGGQEASFHTFNSTTPNASSGNPANGTLDDYSNPGTTWRKSFHANTTTGADTSLTFADVLKSTAGATGNFTCTATQGAAHIIMGAAFRLASKGLIWHAMGPVVHLLPR